MPRFAAALLLALGALLLTPGAGGVPNVPGDPTPPVVTPVVFGTLGANNWYTTNVTVNWTVVDPESVILSTTGCDATTLRTDTTGTKLTCSAVSDGGETTVSKTLKVDKTLPSVTATPGRAPDANGWYDQALTVSFAATDGTSGVGSCVSPQSYTGPDNAAASVAGSCTDQAGNVATASFGLRYDATAPQVTGAGAGRPPDSNGWYNHPVTVSFAGSDGTSGVASCAQPAYGGPDNGSAAVTGTCTDNAGNQSGPGSFGLKYDATGPSVTATPGRTADANGWYNHALTVSFSGIDGASGLDSCVAPKTYSGPDDGAATVSGSCIDRAGNTTVKSLPLKYDATAPNVTATPGRAADSNGWYNHPLSVGFAGSDGTSGVDTCSGSQSYSGPDSAAAAVNGSCLDKAGNVGATAFAVKYDSTGPQVNATPGRGPNVNGWYDQPVTVTFTGSDALSGLGSCVAPQTYSGPDGAAASVGGSCSDKAGNTTGASFGLKYDATDPQVVATPSRGADANGWYNHGLTVSFAGSDATSGIASCVAPQSYSGPDGAAASVGGTCSDKAGNVGAGAFGLKYDATAPQSVAGTPGRGPDANGWYNHALGVSFGGTDASSGIDTCTQANYTGPDTAAASVTGTCSDKAGNQSGTASFGFKYDATGPSVSTSPARSPDANGWYNRPLAVSFGGTDGTSGLNACEAAKTYSGPDSGAAAVAGTCSDRAGNVNTSSFGLKYDSTGPAVAAVAARTPDANGWYNHSVGISFQGNDLTSGLDSCSAPASYAGPDTGSASVSGSCSDRAGNATPGSLAFKYDSTGPQVTATPGRPADSNGWYNHAVAVSFAGTDAVSGLASCVAPKTYSGPDDALGSVTGSCSDNAANSTNRSFGVRYDATAPQPTGASAAREPDANGWYNHAVAVKFAGTDATSGVNTCSEPAYAGPDDPAASVLGSCTDRAGNVSGSTGFALKYDSTGPLVTTAVPTRGPDLGGWYNHAVAYAFLGTDAVAGIDACAPTTYSGPDNAAASVTGTCLDQAGNRGAASFPLKYDGTGPAVTATPQRNPDANGWYNHPTTVAFSGRDTVSGLVSCSSPRGYGGPDSASAIVPGSCLDKAGNVAFSSTSLKYDATAPRMSGASPARPPDAGGWYNHPFSVLFRGVDDMSHIGSCTRIAYGGPDNPAAALSGTCRDLAGNESASLEYGFKYDSTAPRLTNVSAKGGNRVAVLHWDASADVSRVEVARFAPRRTAGVKVYQGGADGFTDKGLTNGVRYRYALKAYDDAGNLAARSVFASPRAPLFSPKAGAKVTKPPLLAWTPVARATYYNVQVWRNRKIFSAWPSGTKLRLPLAWRYQGRRHHLAPGRYRWYVWPGFGARSAKRYGPLLGSSSFVVVGR
ncbi:MAG TPA: hypothetical protein VI110_06795 [Lapillicoccus sp.]